MLAPERSSIRRLPGYSLAAIGAVFLVCALSATAAGAGSIARPVPRILSASWGTDNAVGCPAGEQGLDNIPITFDWFIRRSSIQATDFQIVRSDGSVATPTCALQFPPDESDEGQTVNLIGDFGDSASGPTPVAIRVVGALEGKAPGAIRWRQIPPLPQADVEPLSGGPYIVDAWTLTPAIYRGDANGCTVGKTFVRVMWSNGLTASPRAPRSVPPSSRPTAPSTECRTAGSSQSPRSTSPISTTTRARPTPTTCMTSASPGFPVARS